MTVGIVRLSNLNIVKGPWDVAPGSIQANGLRVDSPPVGWTDGVFKMCSIVYIGDPPTEYHTLNTSTPSINGDVLTVTRTWTPPTLPNAKIILKTLLDQKATSYWLSVRGSDAGIETKVTNGNNAIDGAGNLSAAFAAYNAVTFP